MKIFTTYLPESKKVELREKYNVSDFRALYTFYYPGFNLRATDLQAFIGINQLKNIETVVTNRYRNYNLYNKLIKDGVWKIKAPDNSYVSNFAYPLITDKIDLIVKELNIQPFWYESYGKDCLPNAEKVHNGGLYLPNHHDLTEEEITYISNIINNTI
jgi:CDP-6-deoxy-D-xylo-4-hexulose-3-dehydrase